MSVIIDQKELLARIATALNEQAAKTPYFNLEGYMERNWLLMPPTNDGLLPEEGSGNRTGAGIRMHKILRSDLDPYFHDHPSWSISIVLENGYREWMPRHAHQDYHRDADNVYFVDRKPGDVVIRNATDRHRLELLNGPATSIFIMGAWEQDWGFYLPEGKMPWREYFAKSTTSDAAKRNNAEGYNASRFTEENKNG